ncbi:hypothetical protein KIH27_04920 [Mycobacterium sp. M1]|uniref:Transmembrane protein n=1 Tax=Mycolicibacter acidiphilus TaxID=2835306 RepID=A0ABS5RF67_9MYCO|nr:hypothetical protein [Mycolicibacter acidiphilus]MBS9532930.1 hypothetical protein [Mycolicibacter acidiphilus]
MSRPGARAAVELALAGVAALCSAAAWSHVRYRVLVAPVIDGEPVTSSVAFRPPLLALSLLLATAAGVLVVVAAARVRRAVVVRRRTLPAAVSTAGVSVDTTVKIP